MKKLTWGLVCLMATCVAQAETFNFTGTGKANNAVPLGVSPYTVKISVTDVALKAGDKEARQVTEDYDMTVTDKDGKTTKEPMHLEHIFRLKKDMSLDIERQGTSVGCGYCFEYDNGSRWCNYELHMAQRGTLVASKYYDKSTGTVARIGHYIDPVKGLGNWQDNLSTKKN